MELSARNQLAGTVTDIRSDNVMAEITVDIGGGKQIVAAITHASAEHLHLKKGSAVTAIIKSTEVLIGV